MAYILTLLIALGAFLWYAPAHRVIVDTWSVASDAISRTASAGSGPLQAEMNGLYQKARDKAMELLRGQLHRSVDELVK